MALSPLAGKPAPPESLVDVSRLEDQYYSVTPDVSDPRQRVAFGTSGHRGSPAEGSFNEAHILAMTQAICEHRAARKIDGPLYLGMDTHAVSPLAQRTALEVLAAAGVEVFVQKDEGFTPTPSISRAILAWNRGGGRGRADGIVVTPSHNPPKDGGFKYNPPHGGPADVDVTRTIETRANALLADGLRGVSRVPFSRARSAPTTHLHDFVTPYVTALTGVVDLEAIRGAGVRIGVDPLGGASLPYWEPIRERYRLDLTVVNPRLDPAFSFMTVDHDGQIRMDCSSPYAMASLIGLRDRFDVAFGNDADADRHGIVTPAGGLLNPNHYLAVAVEYLFTHRPGWPEAAGVGKTLVTSSLVDKVAKSLGRRLVEVPVGFKWFVGGLLDGSLGMGLEESAGASFVQMDAAPWTTDKDGILLDLLAAEITAVSGRDLRGLFEDLVARFGMPFYTRLDAAATREEKAALARLRPEAVSAATLAGEEILTRITEASNGASIGGLKVVTAGGWFAARPSGTEDVYKIYAESLKSEEHLKLLVEEARAIVSRALAGA
jgi:phosphoglucomutase